MATTNSQLKSGSRLSTLDGLLQRVLQLCEKECSMVSSKFQDTVADIRKEISLVQNEISSLNRAYLSNMKKLADSVAVIQSDVLSDKTWRERLDKCRDLVVSGIPFSPNENLNDIAHKVALHLGYDSNNFPISFTTRLSKGTIADGATAPVLFQFSTKIARDDYFRRYLKSRDLSLQDLGFDSEKRVYINENLCTVARQIWRLANKFRNDGKLVNVRLRNGVILVRRPNDRNLIPMHSLNELTALIIKPTS